MFVSQNGADFPSCGFRNRPCRTIRHAITIARPGEKILIEYAHKPYDECQDSRTVTYLNKSLTFIGHKGKPTIECKRGAQLFKIPSLNEKITINTTNLILISSNSVIRCDKRSRFALYIRNCVFRVSNIAIAAKSAHDCSITILKSTFYGRTYPSASMSCLNLTAHLVDSTFRASPVSLRTIMEKKTLYVQHTTVFVSNCHFHGEQKKMCGSLLQILPMAVYSNVTIVSSKFTDHFGICTGTKTGNTLYIKGNKFAKKRKQTLIHLNNLTLKDNRCTGTILRLEPLQKKVDIFDVVISNSLFENTSSVLYVFFDRSRGGLRGKAVRFVNNTFINTHKYRSSRFNNLHLNPGKFLFTKCTFIDNYGGNEPNDAVIGVSSYSVAVIFRDCYFENSNPASSSTLIFSQKKNFVLFQKNNTFNITATQRELNVIAYIFTKPDNVRRFRLQDNLKILCPYGYVMSKKMFCYEVKNKAYVECNEFVVKCKPCQRNTYSVSRAILHNNITNSINCQDCANGGQCYNGRLTAKPNYWGYKVNQSVRFIRCPHGYCCQGNDCVTYSSCHGKRQGKICGECPHGMSVSLFSAACIPNANCGHYDAILFGLGYCIVYLVFFLYHKEIIRFVKRIFFTSSKETNSGLLKIVFYYYQISRFLVSPTNFESRQTAMTEVRNKIGEIFNFIIMSIPFLECPIRDLNDVTKQTILHSLGYVLLTFLAVLFTATILKNFVCKRFKSYTSRDIPFSIETDARDDGKDQSFEARIASAYTLISLLMYASSTQLCLSLLHCVPLDDEQVLHINGNVKCYQLYQYIFLAYFITSILPFCLVPVLGSHLLRLEKITVKHFCMACLFPLPFCCYWLYLFTRIRGFTRMGQHNNDHTMQDICEINTNNEETNIECHTAKSTNSISRILHVLQGPFRLYKADECSTTSRIPWEGFLIFRRLVLIVVLTFLYDVKLRMLVALTICVAILICHMLVFPFQTKRDNIVESIFLAIHVILCGITLVKTLYHEEGNGSYNAEKLLALDAIRDIIILSPMFIILMAVVLSLVIKISNGLKCFATGLFRKIKRTGN